MQSEPNTSTVASPRWRRTLTVLAAASMVVAACGSESQQAGAEPSDADGADGVEYGASLDEWSESADSTEASARPSSNGPSEGFTEITWEDLLPAGYSSDEIFARYEDQLSDLEDGSPEAQAIYEEMKAEYHANSGDINDELDGTKVNLAGFVAPLNNDGDVITEFLLVPYFGACIHVPAPPANQTVLVKVDKADGITMEQSWGPVWVAGTLTLDSATTDLATASYTITDATSGVYTEFG